MYTYWNIYSHRCTSSPILYLYLARYRPAHRTTLFIQISNSIPIIVNMQRAGRRRSGRPTYSQGAPSAAAVAPQPKEEPSSQLHDEADLISFRADTLARFISNQELMENVTSKYVHTLKIEPPTSFPKVNIEIDAIKPDDVFFGSVEAMKKRIKLDDESISKINEQSTDTGFDETYHFQQDALKKLSALQAHLNSNEVLDLLLQVSKEVNSGLAKRGQKFTELPRYSTKSIKFTDITVNRAPKDYDLHNLQLLQHETALVPPPPVTHLSGPEESNESANQYVNNGQRETEAMLNNQPTSGRSNEINNGIPGDEDHDMKQFSAMDFMSFDRPADQAQSHNAAGSFMMAESKVDDLHGLFDGGEMEGNDMDNMDNLINFQDEEGEFGHDFLSQIDHSME